MLRRASALAALFLVIGCGERRSAPSPGTHPSAPVREAPPAPTSRLHVAGETAFGVVVPEGAVVRTPAEGPTRAFHVPHAAEEVVAFYREHLSGTSFRPVGRGGTFDPERGSSRPVRVVVVPLGADRTLVRLSDQTPVDAGVVDAAVAIERMREALEHAE